jgi:isopenicillin-N epimerase
VPAAIEFQRDHQWDEVRQRCHKLASLTRQHLTDLTGLTPLTPDSPNWFAQMIAIPLPEGEAKKIQGRLYDEYHIEVPMTVWHERNFVRVSVQGYNTSSDFDCLVEALGELYHLPVHSKVG